MIKRIGTGPRMSEAVIHGQTVYLAGQVGDGASVTEQTQDCLRRVDEILAKAGTSKENILQTIIWVADMADFAEMNAVYAGAFETNPPARSAYQVVRLPKDAKVEIEAIAVAD